MDLILADVKCSGESGPNDQVALQWLHC